MTAKTLAAGSLRHRVALLTFSPTQDEVGQPIRVWTTTADGVPANVRFLTGTETIRAGAETAIQRVSVRIRWRAGVTTDMRVRHDGRDFDIVSVNPDPTGRVWLDLVGREAV